MPMAAERLLWNPNMTLQDRIDAFLKGSPHAVVGASRDRGKYGNKVLRVYMQNGRPVFPVNPKEQEIEGLACSADLASLPQKVHGISVITPPAVTEKVVEQAAAAGIRHIWMQPGAESAAAIDRCRELDINCIGGDACLLVVLGYHEIL